MPLMTSLYLPGIMGSPDGLDGKEYRLHPAQGRGKRFGNALYPREKIGRSALGTPFFSYLESI
jgi:hypothetical protein